ncbi:MAG TPA: hypothetical protein VGW33_13285 [Terriglobia bacterium]|nr:hypothetical protein [Terriglobia bacterium]
MLVFLAPYPDKAIERDGLVQRVTAIDSIFEGVPRMYLQVSFKRPQRKVETHGRVTVERANFFLHGRHITRSLQDAKWIYIHSVWSGLRLLPWLRGFGSKIIFDAHGVLPEEMAFAGNRTWAAITERGERALVRNCHLMVTVTDAMARHFLEKYPGVLEPSQILTLPIFVSGGASSSGVSEPPQSREARTGSGDLRLVYAGGVDKWQNVDLTLDTLRRLAGARPDVSASLYVPQSAVSGLKEKVRRASLDGRIEVGSLSHEEMLRQYARMDAGFVLRDDTLMNRVAMPTKLVEYLAHGVVPIVLSPHIGDFAEYGYRYLTLADLFDPTKLCRATLDRMRERNCASLVAVRAATVAAKKKLESLMLGEAMAASDTAG